MKEVSVFVAFGFIGLILLYFIAAALPQRKLRPKTPVKSHEEVLKNAEEIENRIHDSELKEAMEEWDRQQEFRRIHGSDDEDVI